MAHASINSARYVTAPETGEMVTFVLQQLAHPDPAYPSGIPAFRPETARPYGRGDFTHVERLEPPPASPALDPPCDGANGTAAVSERIQGVSIPLTNTLTEPPGDSRHIQEEWRAEALWLNTFAGTGQTNEQRLWLPAAATSSASTFSLPQHVANRHDGVLTGGHPQRFFFPASSPRSVLPPAAATVWMGYTAGPGLESVASGHFSARTNGA